MSIDLHVDISVEALSIQPKIIVTGQDTYDIRDQLNAAGYRWQPPTGYPNERGYWHAPATQGHLDALIALAPWATYLQTGYWLEQHQHLIGAV